MISRLAFPLFLALSVMLHIAPWVFWSDTGRRAAGGGGDQAITLEATSPGLGALVAEWSKPPSMAPDVTAPSSVPTADHAPSPPVSKTLAATPSVSRPALHYPAALPLPIPMVAIASETPLQLDTKPPTPLETPQHPEPETPSKPQTNPGAQAKPEPKSKPQAKPKPAPSSAAQVAERAKGPGQSSSVSGGTAKQTTGNTKQQANLMRKWGAQIQARIERQKRRELGKGKVRLRLVVHTSGRLQSVSLIQGSSTPALNARAISMAKRARPPKAPRKLATGSYPFVLTIEFNS